MLWTEEQKSGTTDARLAVPAGQPMATANQPLGILAAGNNKRLGVLAAENNKEAKTRCDAIFFLCSQPSDIAIIKLYRTNHLLA